MHLPYKISAPNAAYGVSVVARSRPFSTTPSPSFLSSSSTLARSSTSRYPFPKSKDPSPHEIFHLPVGASQADIKARYFELVKIYHPDANSSSSQPSTQNVNHERFQAITSAYNYLTRKPGSAKWPGDLKSHGRYDGPHESFREELHRRKAMFTNDHHEAPRQRAWRGKRNQWGGFEYEYDDIDPLRAGGPHAYAAKDASPTDRMFYIIFGLGVVGVLSQLAIFSPGVEAARSHASALQYLEEARRGRDEHGEMRRKELKKLVQQEKQRQHASEKGNAGSEPETMHDVETKQGHP